jgi:hypothetical protein
MFVVEVGVKTECKIYGCRSTQELNWVQNNSIFLGLVVKQLKIFGFKTRTALFT